MTQTNLERARFNMIQQQIRPWYPISSRVLDTMQSIPRENFAPAAYRNVAFADVDIPLGNGFKMASPKLEARMLDTLEIRPGDNILEIGTGSGYVTACLTRLGGYVTSIDNDPAVIAQAGEHLSGLGINNISLAEGNLDSLPQGSFDAILLAAGSLPQRHAGLEQALTLGGRLFAIIGNEHLMEACLITRLDEENWRCAGLFETELPPLADSRGENTFQF